MFSLAKAEDNKPPKAVCVAISPKLMHFVTKELAKSNVSISELASTQDVGVDFATGKRNVHRPSLNKRLKSKSKYIKIAKLARSFRQARKLFNASQYSSSTWGHPAHGLSGNQLLRMERQAAQFTGITPAGRCRFTAPAVAYRPRGHPAASIIKDTFSYWFKVIL